MGINLDNLDPELREKIINLQNLQQNYEFLTNQKMQIESNKRETELAIEELEKAEPEEEVYKSIGGIMVKSNKDKVLEEKKSLSTTLEMRLKTVNQKMERTKKQLEEMRKTIQGALQTQGA